LVQSGRSLVFHDVHGVEIHVGGDSVTNCIFGIENMFMSNLKHVVAPEHWIGCAAEEICPCISEPPLASRTFIRNTIGKHCQALPSMISWYLGRREAPSGSLGVV
jgi:hypothetical protein